MNRQAIAFLTMFSLVLMLAVYYITMPIQQGDETPVVSTPNTFEQMKIELNNKQQSLLESYTETMASSTSTSQEKAIAMEQMSKLNQVMNDEKIYTDMLHTLGYENCYLEIEQDVMKIHVQSDSFDTSDASKIIKTVLSQSNYQYIPEVSFSK
ncbi:MAG: SpoIIIAH-like family protein [Erysipelotrichaceae bacterium]|nr:SpoIIIAH-like family protein [Erysipelotrichaceae bacterium]